MLANGIATFDEAKAVSDAVVAAVEVLGECEGEQAWQDYKADRSSN